AVDISGTTYIADVGFGGLTLTAPLKLRPDVEQTTPHGTFRLTGGEPEWRLEARIGDEWRGPYGFAPPETKLEDYAASNAVLSTDPDSPFRHELRVALAPEGQRLMLRNTRLTIHTQGEPSESRVLTSVADIREVLVTNFGIHLPPSEVLD